MDMENVSNMLLEARLAKGLTLEEAEAATSIRKLYLDAVEKGEFEKVPGEVFTKGIIRTYGNFLGPEKFLPKASSAHTVIFWASTGRSLSIFTKHKPAGLPKKPLLPNLSAWLKKSAYRRRLNLKGYLPATG